MNFKQLNEKIQYQFSNLVKTGKLFTVNITGKSLLGNNLTYDTTLFINK
jgi:hypothetical protein